MQLFSKIVVFTIS